MPSEAVLVERARSDATAFDELYRRHYTAIGAYLYRRTGDVTATEDLLSDTFLRALKGLPRFRARGIEFRHWLYRIATNVSNRWSTTRRRRPTPSLDAADERGAVPPDPVELRAERDAVRRSVARLPRRFRSVIALHHLAGLPIEEVAAVLRCRVGTVKSRLSRGRARLRRLLQAP